VYVPGVRVCVWGGGGVLDISTANRVLAHVRLTYALLRRAKSPPLRVLPTIIKVVFQGGCCSSRLLQTIAAVIAAT
jgi:hypothetical protein